MSDVTVGNLACVESKFEWKISNFRSYAGYENGKLLSSPCFSTYYNEKNSETNTLNLQWQLNIYPSGDQKKDNGYVCIHLVNRNDFNVNAMFSITLMKARGNSNILRIMSEEKVFKTRGHCGAWWGWRKFVNKESIFSEQSEFLVDNTLTISCSIFGTSLSLDNADSPMDVHLEALNHLENLLESEKFADVTFQIGEKKIQVHKAILTTVSEVFQAMFDHDMQEQKDGVVNIVDIEFNVMKEMFRYIYARKVNNIDKIASNLLVAADKYCVTGLKQLCEKTLCKKLNVDNALQYLELAMEYNATKLKSKTLDFAVNKLKNIVKTEEFQSLSSECKSELLLHIACNQ